MLQTYIIGLRVAAEGAAERVSRLALQIRGRWIADQCPDGNDDHGITAGREEVESAMRQPVRANGSNPFFARLARPESLAEEDIDSLRHVVEREQLLPKRKDLLLEGYGCAAIYIVKNGFGICYKLLPNGNRQILNVVLAGDITGLPAAFFDRAPYSVTSLTPMVVDVVPLGRFFELCYAKPKIGFTIMALLWEQKHIRVATHLISIGRRSPIERVAHFIMELYVRLRDVGHTKGNSLELPLSQEVIGDVLGLSAPHVNRMFRQLKEMNLISMSHHSLRIDDVEGLKMLAKFAYPHPGRIPPSTNAANVKQDFARFDKNRSDDRDISGIPDKPVDAFAADAPVRLKTPPLRKIRRSTVASDSAAKA